MLDGFAETLARDPNYPTATLCSRYPDFCDDIRRLAAAAQGGRNGTPYQYQMQMKPGYDFSEPILNVYIGAQDVDLQRPRATAVSWREFVKTLQADLPAARGKRTGSF